MERIKKVMEKVKRSPLTLDCYFRKYFEMDTAQLKNFKGGFHELLASQLTLKLSNELGCINLEMEDPSFEELKTIIKRCVEKNKPKKKGRQNANTRAQVRRRS